MSKIILNALGCPWSHTICSSANNENKYVTWVYDELDSKNITFHIDDAIHQHIDKNKNTLRYAWLAESSSIAVSAHSWVKENIQQVEDNYELIFTHDKRLLHLSPKMRHVIPNAVPWILPENRKIWTPKSKLCSMVASGKNMCLGHQIRQHVIRRLSPHLDHFGWHFRQLEHKELAMIDYMFSVAMENDNYPSIWTEKITDCFITGTIPVYWGDPDIGEIFNTQGIIILTDDFKVSDLNQDLYYSKMEFIKENFEIAMSIPTAEDNIFLNFLS